VPIHPQLNETEGAADSTVLIYSKHLSNLRSRLWTPFLVVGLLLMIFIVLPITSRIKEKSERMYQRSNKPRSKSTTRVRVQRRQASRSHHRAIPRGVPEAGFG
jgi:hypothetical protein